MSGGDGSHRGSPVTPPPPLALAHDDFSEESYTDTTPAVLESPGIRSQPPPPGASQPNDPIVPTAPIPSNVWSPTAATKHSQQKFSLLRKKGKTPSSPTPPATSSSPVEDDDDAWLLEGTSSNGQVNATVSVGREASTLSCSVDTLSLADSDIGDPASSNGPSGLPPASAGRSEKRLSKPRALAKKTSRLFSRNGHNHNHQHHHHEESSSGASLSLPGAPAVRQTSISSTASSDSRQKHWNLTHGHGVARSSPSSSRGNFEQHPSHPPSSFALRRTVSTASHSTTDTDVIPIPPVPERPEHSHHNTVGSSLPTPRNDPTATPESTRQDSKASGRMTSWFSNLLPTNTDSPSPSSEPAPGPSSPLRKPAGVASSILSAARNKAVGGMRYLLDSEAQPDHCQDIMWVMGVPHPGYQPHVDDPPLASEEPSGPTAASSSPSSWTTRFKEGSGTYASSPPTRSGLGHFFGSSFNIAAQAGEPATPPSTRKEKQKELPRWPEQFYDDFRSRVWCTYRSQYAPIVPLPPGQLLPTPDSYFGGFVVQPESQLPQPGQTSIGTGAQPSSRLSNGPWGWVKGGDSRGLTSDAGWGCMLRTGQSILANALIHLHLGRGWRLPSNKPSMTPESPLELAELEAYATYVRILSWFLDDPSPLCPFSVHRMALIGKELGKEVGEWFGPSTAAGALKTLVNSFPLCGLSVVNAVDGIIYRSDVYTASNMSSDDWQQEDDGPRLSRPSSVHRSGWGGKAVLVLIGIRLGLDGVNPLYYDSIKTLFTFPQSVGIAGGRPSSSYYFVASQASSLFYLDPHFTRQTVPLRTPPPNAAMPPKRKTASSVFTRDSLDEENEDAPLASTISRTSESSPLPSVDVVNVDRDSADAPIVPSSPLTDLQSPSKPRRRLTLTQTLRIKPGNTPPRKNSAPTSPTTPTLKGLPRRTSQTSPSPVRPLPTRHSTASSSSSLRSRALPIDPQTAWYASAYSESNLKTFHCDKVKKMPLSGLDPSMLLGFLCQNEAEFEDFCERVAKLPQKIFAVQEEPPLWSEDEDGLESVSDPASDFASEAESDREEEPELEFDDLDEFGQMSTPARPRPRGPQRDDTITPLNVAATGLILETVDADDDDADTEAEVNTMLRKNDRSERTLHRYRKTSIASARKIPREPEVAADEWTLDDTPCVDVSSSLLHADVNQNKDLPPTPQSGCSPSAASTARPIALRQSHRRLRAEARRHRARPEVEPVVSDEDGGVFVGSGQSEGLGPKKSVASPASQHSRPESREHRDVKTLSRGDAPEPTYATEPPVHPALERGSPLHPNQYDDADVDTSFEGEFASTPSSAPILVERPTP